MEEARGDRRENVKWRGVEVSKRRKIEMNKYIR